MLDRRTHQSRKPARSHLKVKVLIGLLDTSRFKS